MGSIYLNPNGVRPQQVDRRSPDEIVGTRCEEVVVVVAVGTGAEHMKDV